MTPKNGLFLKIVSLGVFLQKSFEKEPNCKNFTWIEHDSCMHINTT